MQKRTRFSLTNKKLLSSESSFFLYRNNLKNREVDKEAFQNSHLERATIVRAQGTSEEENFEKKPTPSKTDSSGCFGIYRNNFCSDAIVEELSLFGELPASLFTFQPVA